jgi:hypothetical protein
MILPILSIIGSLAIIAGLIWLDRIAFDRYKNRKKNAEIDKEIEYFRGER